MATTAGSATTATTAGTANFATTAGSATIANSLMNGVGGIEGIEIGSAQFALSPTSSGAPVFQTVAIPSGTRFVNAQAVCGSRYGGTGGGGGGQISVVMTFGATPTFQAGVSTEMIVCNTLLQVTATGLSDVLLAAGGSLGVHVPPGATNVVFGALGAAAPFVADPFGVVNFAEATGTVAFIR